MWKEKLKKSLLFSQKMCYFSFFNKWKIFFFSCEKKNWEKSLFFFYMRRKIEKNFFSSLMWKEKRSKILSLFSSLNGYPAIMITIEIMIDNKITHNFVEIDTQFQNFRYFDEIVLKIYKFHSLNVNVINQQNAKTRS